MPSTTHIADQHADIHNREATDGTGMTILRDVFRSTGGVIVNATSANGRWGYTKEGSRRWVVIDKHEHLPLEFCASLAKARRHTYGIDHPAAQAGTEPTTTPAQYSLRGGHGKATR